MHHCWVSFFSEVNSKTVALPAQRTRMCVGRLGTGIFLVRDKQNCVHERSYFHCCQTTLTQQTEAALTPWKARGKEKTADMFMIPFTALLFPGDTKYPLSTNAGVTANKSYKDWGFSCFVFPTTPTPPPKKIPCSLWAFAFSRFSLRDFNTFHKEGFSPKKKVRG